MAVVGLTSSSPLTMSIDAQLEPFAICAGIAIFVALGGQEWL